MRFRPSDRMLQLGVVPQLTAYVRQEYPQASASLWQRGAKAAHRRILARASEIEGDGPFAKQARTVVSLASLLLAFHESATEGVEVDEASFARMVDAALGTPIAHMLFAGADPFSEAGTRELAGLLQAGASSQDTLQWAGTLRLEDAPGQGGGRVLVAEVARCGLLRLCVMEQRLYLLKHLCKIEGLQAAACGARLSCDACLACGDRTCVLRCTRGA